MRLLEQQHSDGEGVSLLGVRFLRRFHNLDRQQAYHFEKLTSAFSDRTWVCFARRWHHLKGISIKSLLISSTVWYNNGNLFSLNFVSYLNKIIREDRRESNRFHIIVFETLNHNFVSFFISVSGLSNSNKLIRRFLGGLHGIYFIPSEQRRIGVYTVNLLEGKERTSVCHQESPLWTTNEFHSIPIASKIKRLLVVCLLVSLRSTRRLIPL